MNYYVHHAGETFGPFSPETVITMLRTNQLAAEDLAVEEGCENWQPLSKIVGPQLLGTSELPKPPPFPQPQGERVFYSSPGVTVTLTRFVVGSQTFAMRNISSVRIKRIDPSRAMPVIGACLGGLCIFGEDTRIFGILLTTVMIVIMFFQRSQYAIVLTASGGETRALCSQNRQWINEVSNALNEAIIARG